MLTISSRTNLSELVLNYTLSKGGIETAGRVRYSIELRSSETTAEVLEKISANTERELVPFVSAARQTTGLGVKPFVSSTSGNRFRVWRVPIARRRRHSRNK